MNWTDPLDDPALGDFATLVLPGGRALVRRGFEGWIAALDAAGARTSATTMVEGGRASHPVVELPDAGRAVLRTYHRGGAMRHLNRDRYFLGHRAFDELRVTERARGAGVRAAEVIAAVEWRRGVGYGAMIATRWIADTVGLDRFLAGAAEDAALAALRGAGEQIGAIHASGIDHPDLNLRNLLVRGGKVGPAGEVYVIDFDRARAGERALGARQRARGLERLARSARKLAVPLSPDGVEALRQGYGPDWPASADPG